MNLFYLVAFLVLLTSSAGVCSAQYSQNDGLCGVRCVDFLLDHYGLPRPPLSVLAKEIPFNDSAPFGTSLADIEFALRKRGLHVMGVQVEKGAVVEWPEPVVVHLIGSDYPSGHFAIMLPKSTAKFARIWQANPGDAGSVVKVADLTPSMSGSVLLTSRSPISLSALKFKANQITLAEAALILPVLLVVLWILCDSVGRFNSRRLLPVAIHR